MKPEPEQRLVPGIPNFRDVGGTRLAGGRRLRSGVLFRTQAVIALSPPDLRRLDNLDIRSFCDLRSSRERYLEPSVGPDVPAANMFHLEVISDQESSAADLMHALLSDPSGETLRLYLGQLAQTMPVTFAPKLTVLFEALVQQDNALPLLVGCRSGKDRTGFVVTVILLALGADDDVIVEEFQKSADYIDGQWLFDSMSAWADPLETPIEVSRLHEVSFLREYPLTWLRVIREQYGSVDRFLREACGLDDRARAVLQERLTVAGE